MWFWDIVHQQVGNVPSNLIIEYSTNCKVISPDYEFQHISYIRCSEGGLFPYGDIIHSKYENKDCVLKERCNFDKEPNDQVDNEFLLCLKISAHANIVLPWGVVLSTNYKRVRCLLFEKWHHENLQNFIYSKKPQWNLQTRQYLFLEIIQGLKWIQLHNIIHQDLCSKNILLQLDSNQNVSKIAICDFGVAIEFKENLFRKVNIGHYECQVRDDCITFAYDIFGLFSIATNLVLQHVPIQSYNQEITDVNQCITTIKRKLKQQQQPEQDEQLQINNQELSNLMNRVQEIKQNIQLVTILLQCNELNFKKRPTCDDLISFFSSQKQQKLTWK